jgi:hypothetical protein
MAEWKSKYTRPGSQFRLREKRPNSGFRLRGKERQAQENPGRNTFAKVAIHDIPNWSQWHGPLVALHLEIVRLSSLPSVKRRDGWAVFSESLFERVGLSNRDTRKSVVRRAVQQRWLEVRRSQGAYSQFAYRLRPTGTHDGVMDLAAIRNRRQKGASQS